MKQNNSYFMAVTRQSAVIGLSTDRNPGPTETLFVDAPCRRRLQGSIMKYSTHNRWIVAASPTSPADSAAPVRYVLPAGIHAALLINLWQISAKLLYIKL